MNQVTTQLGRPRKISQTQDHLRLTPRDYEILKYLYDQKFCSLETLYHRFFDNRKEGQPIPHQMRVTRLRLQALKRTQMIQSEKVYSESKSVYLIAQRGFYALSGRYPGLVFGPPIKSVDFRNYEHDKRVNLVRVVLEKTNQAMLWYPERRIRLEGFKVGGNSRALPKTVIPDAIILTPDGKRIAIEVELSVRKKKRFRFKVDELSSVMWGNPPLLHEALFVACSDVLLKDLTDITRGKKGFRVEPISNFSKFFNN